MGTEIPVYYADDVIPTLVDYCERNRLGQFYLVADQNTYAVLGKAVTQALTSRGFDVKAILLEGEDVVNDEYCIVQVLVQADLGERVFLAVGSGTITDIVRLVSHRTHTSFISLPTAPSVDGYTSGGAPTVLGGFKQTIYAHPPTAIFADIKTLREAPRPMIAAGFGDILGKYTSAADWKLGRLLWDEPYSEEIAQRVWNALQGCVQNVDSIGAASAEGIRKLMDALVESGLCMLDFGQSHPASGAEHYLSHFLELKLLKENRPAILHGAKVGVTCILVARYYEKIRGLAIDQVREYLEDSPLPDREQEIQRIRMAYPEIADELMVEQAPYLNMSEADYDALKQKIIDHWPDIQAIAAIVPPPDELANLLRKVGGAVDAQTLGLDDEEVDMALEYAHYYRGRFTVIKLSHILGVRPFNSYVS